jgi:hypothetical protein
VECSPFRYTRAGTMTREQLVLSGRLTVRLVDRDGRERARVVHDNEIVNAGRTLIGQLWSAVPARCPFRTSPLHERHPADAGRTAWRRNRRHRPRAHRGPAP